MSNLEWSEILKRKVRGGTLNEVMVPNWTLIKDAIKTGNMNEAAEMVEYCHSRTQVAYNSLAVMANELLTVIADNLGEEAIEKIWRARYARFAVDFLRTAGTAEEFVKRMTEMGIDHCTEATITEEPDRYVVKYDPCGSGGIMRRTIKAGEFKKAYPWTWSRVGIPYYCAHCCMELEILPIEIRGYPLAITECGEKPEDPCIRIYYKRPELIPERYFTRVGKKKSLGKSKAGKSSKA